jgi:hypothetical protein
MKRHLDPLEIMLLGLVTVALLFSIFALMARQAVGAPMVVLPELVIRGRTHAAPAPSARRILTGVCFERADGIRICN